MKGRLRTTIAGHCSLFHMFHRSSHSTGLTLLRDVPSERQKVRISIPYFAPSKRLFWVCRFGRVQRLSHLRSQRWSAEPFIQYKIGTRCGFCNARTIFSSSSLPRTLERLPTWLCIGISSCQNSTTPCKLSHLASRPVSGRRDRLVGRPGCGGAFVSGGFVIQFVIAGR